MKRRIMNPRPQKQWAALAALTVAFGSLFSLGNGIATAQSEDPAAVRALAERSLGAGPFNSVSLLVGQVPAGIPNDLTPSGWKLLGTVSQKNQGPNGQAFVYSVVHYDAPAGTTDLYGPLRDRLAARGWTILNVPNGPTGGFVTSPTGQPFTACASDGKLFANVYSNGFFPGGPTPQAGAPLPVAININDASLGSPCSNSGGLPQTTMPILPAPYMEAPSLSLPASATVVGTNGGGGINMFSSSVTVESSDSPAELAAFFAKQISAAGWVRRTNLTDDNASYSIWRKTVNGKELQLALTAASSVGNNKRRELTMTVTSEDVTNNFGVPYPVPAVAASAAPGLAPVTTVAAPLNTVAGTATPDLKGFGQDPQATTATKVTKKPAVKKTTKKNAKR